ncbi:MAG: ABC transporter permease [Sphingomonadaceae bacterium]|nr:ABC transporter permease [Sphingomonadaceae bacterium]
MWRNHVTVGLRALLRDPLFTIINLVGLAIGIAGCLMIVLFIRYETSFDDWLPDAGQVFQVQRIKTSGENMGQRAASMPFVASTALPTQFPEIEAATGVVYGDNVFRRNGNVVGLDYVYATDGNFLSVLQLPLVQGNPATALASVDDIILSESAARRIFGRTDVVGRTLTRIAPGGDRDSRVTGILRDIPGNSHLKIDAVYRANTISPAADDRTFTRWNTISGWVYVKLRPGADAAAINGRMPAVLQRLVPTVDQDPTAADRLGFNAELVNVRAINTGPVDRGTMRAGTPQKTLVTFGIVAAFLLLVACVNFTNLATARASRRAREVGLRKTLGATRRQLIWQFLLEAFVAVAAAGLLALALVELTLPMLNDLLRSDIQVRYFAAGGVFPPLLLLLGTIGLFGGLYPAFFLSRYRPSVVLKGGQNGSEAPGAGRLRTFLVVLQFAVSIALIICTSIIYMQTLFARSADPGYKVSGLLFVLGPDDVGDRTRVETFMRRIGAIHGVTSVARSGITPNPNSVAIATYRAPGSTESVSAQVVAVDGNTFRTLGMHLLAGRNVTEAREADLGAPPSEAETERTALVERRGLNVVLSESAAHLFGYATPASAIGRQIIPDTDDGHAVAPFTIVGIVNDARFESARFSSVPKLYYVAPSGHLSIAVRFENEDGAAVMSAIETLWKANVDRATFNAFFADERIANMYRADERRGKLFAIFTTFAVLISCLGLFGLAAFSAQRRTKEIGIRKVLGARTRDIIRLLVWRFTRPVLLANLIAWPVAWWAMRNWLDEFQDRIAIGPTPFAVAGGVALAIAVGTIVGHAIKVARANPIHALRHE